MENAEEIFHFLEDFSKRKPKTIPQELNEYLAYVARTGDPVYQWPLVKCLFKEKLLNVITDFYETTPGIDIPPYPNVDPFNYDIMKNSLLERLDAFTSAPFTVQRICELLTFPRKQYNRIDKFMRAIEKNILVVSTREPGAQRHAEPENGEAVEPVVNGSDSNSEYNVDVEMEDMSWKENAEQQSSEPQPSSSDTHITVDDIEARLQAKQNVPMETQDKTPTEYESVTPPELNVGTDDPISEDKAIDTPITEITPVPEITEKSDSVDTPTVLEEAKTEVEMKSDITESPALIIPEITVDDAEMTEQKLVKKAVETEKKEEVVPEKVETPEEKAVEETVTEQSVSTDESSSDSTMKEEEPKHISEVSTSSEESSSSSDNTDGNSNSPKTDESNTDTVQDQESNQETIKLEEPVKEETKGPEIPPSEEKKVDSHPVIESDNYSISDISSGLPQPPNEAPSQEETPSEALKGTPEIQEENKEEAKTESIKKDPEAENS